MVASFLIRVVDWLREGYPSGIPRKDTIPVIALLRRRLTSEEVAEVVEELRAQGLLEPDPADVGTEITKITDELPHPEDLERVFTHLEFGGFPDPDGPDGPSDD